MCASLKMTIACHRTGRSTQPTELMMLVWRLMRRGRDEAAHSCITAGDREMCCVRHTNGYLTGDRSEGAVRNAYRAVWRVLTITLSYISCDT